MVRLLIAALVIPLGLDLYMPVPEDNPITAEKIDLGRRLFNDRRLSRDGTIACSSCRGGNRHALLDPELQPLGLSEFEKRALIAFLRALSGELTR